MSPHLRPCYSDSASPPRKDLALPLTVDFTLVFLSSYDLDIQEGLITRKVYSEPGHMIVADVFALMFLLTLCFALKSQTVVHVLLCFGYTISVNLTDVRLNV